MSGRNFHAADARAQESLGARLGEACVPVLRIHLAGDLGAGKTTLVRGLLRGRGHQGAVRSPTYTLVEPYELASGNFYHLDLYRLGDPGELEYLGLREALDGDAVLLIEWPERGAGWLPPPDLLVHIAYAASGRDVAIEAHSPRGEAVLQRL